MCAVRWARVYKFLISNKESLINSFSNLILLKFKANDSRIIEVFRNKKILNLYLVAFLFAIIDFSQGFLLDNWPSLSISSF
jgi:hypothetical protein